MGKSLLISGATGAVGSEVGRRFVEDGEFDVVLTSRRGREADGVVAWDMSLPPPPVLRRDWSCILNVAACTRWNMTPRAAYDANVRTAISACRLAGPATHLVHISTAYVEDPRKERTNKAVRGYRNAYEWSKAVAEREVARRARRLTLVRPPLVIGSSMDGAIARFSGSYSLFQGLASGLVAAIVGEPLARIELVPVDLLADAVHRAVRRPAGGPTAPVVLGAGSKALTLEQVFGIARDVLNHFRGAHGVDPVDMPPFIPKESWDRFFYPFARDELSPLQLRVVELLSEFQAYSSDGQAYVPNRFVPAPDLALKRSVEYWIGRNPRTALRRTEPWSRSR